MAYGLKCYCCGDRETSDTHFFCYECVIKMKRMFESGVADFGSQRYAILDHPKYQDHCIRCSDFENRRIIEIVDICDQCVYTEWQEYKREQKDSSATSSTAE